MNNYVNILGISFSKLTLMDTVNLIDNKIKECKGKTFHIITVNPEIAIDIQEDSELKKISLEADLITPDGVGIVLASKLKRNPIPERVTGFDLLLELLKLGNQRGWSFYFFGSEESVNKKMAEYVTENYPNVKVAGRHNGFFNKQEETQIIEDIENSKPDILIVALGSPLADKWIYTYKDRIPAKVTFGVGGSLDVITGKVKRTPEIWKKMKLEWLHRRIITPSRKERQKRLKIFAYRAFVEVVYKNSKQ
ncbi:WecB/TagA/CpsF family glycosyltransferase [Tissierella sp. MB52-C2]|uniref:WecB/TagA/CpsF family glycosyltransferase n=1 Tax=Tissierella sp. MB52-C2 TaxID=3070999 RepID=UPI00280B2A32|nr:WecB/TagA/CpsF family glycosyltransferase [Tissierella sp. MB52-C2]WMM26537.1 WecB/TagA/CpsF family glycosyltransferase [Tissierella sp. MB52-C2]